MGIQINGTSDKITATDGSLSIEGYNGNVTGNVTGPGNSTFLGSVGIGTDNPSHKLHVKGAGETALMIEGNAAPASAGGLLILKNNNTTANSLSQIQSADAGGQTTSAISFYNVDNGTNEGYMSFLTRPSGGVPTEAARFNSSGNLAFPSGQGIDFSSGISSTTATDHILDDYEEGTWSAVLHYNTSNTDTSGTGNATINANSAQYTKIGKLVFINCQFTSASTANYLYLKVYGLPFVSTGTADLHVYVRGGLYRYNTSTASAINFSARIYSGSSYFELNSERTDITSSGWIQIRTASQTLSISGCYLAS